MKTTVTHRQTQLRPERLEIGVDRYYNDITEDPNGTTRIFYQNIAGIPADAAVLHSTLDTIKSFKASYYGLQETKVNQRHNTRMSQINRACIKQMNTKPKMQSNTTSYIHSHHQPGGLAVITGRGLDSNKNTTIKDPTALVQTSTIVSKGVKLKIMNVHNPRQAKEHYQRAIKQSIRSKG